MNRQIQVPSPNHFDLLRLTFALLVVLSHSATLSAAPELAWLPTIFSSQLAVEGFFIISGFLITASYERLRDLPRYTLHRFRRIYPAYVTVILLSILLGSLITTTDHYWTSDTARYFFWNLLFLNFLHPTLPGVFPSNPLTAVNGALWTLKIEVMFYLILPLLLALLRRIPLWLGLGSIYLASSLYSFILSTLAYQQGEGGYLLELSRQLPGQMRFFITGIGFYYLLPHFLRQARCYALLAATFWLAATGLPLLEWLRPLTLGILIMFAAFCIPAPFSASRWGDLSYGTYILHFPLIQWLVSIGLFTTTPFLALSMSVCGTLFGAFLLWHGIEKHALHRKRCQKPLLR